MASQPSWDLGRFLSTLTDFDVLPFSDTVRQVGRWIQGLPQEETMSVYPWTSPAWIVIAGVTPSIRQPLLQRLQQQNLPVRVVTSESGGLSSRSATHQQAGAAATIPQILSAARALILGPELDRERLQALLQTWGQRPPRVVFDFSQPNPELRQLWGAVDDVVMGGVSQSSLQVIEGMALFAGSVSTANSGGFASIRTRNLEKPVDLSGYEGIQLRVRGDGKRYKLFLRTQNTWDSLAYGISFDTEASQWLTLRLPFAEMIPVFRAQRVEDAPPLDPSQIRAIQLMLSKFEFGKQLNPQFSPGPFALQLATLGAYGETSAPTPVLLIHSCDLDASLKFLLSILSTEAIPYLTFQLQTPESGSADGQTAEEVVTACVQSLTQGPEI